MEYRRFMAYLDNVKEINEHNERYKRDEETYEVAINHLTDMVTARLLCYFILKFCCKYITGNLLNINI